MKPERYDRILKAKEIIESHRMILFHYFLGRFAGNLKQDIFGIIISSITFSQSFPPMAGGRVSGF